MKQDLAKKLRRKEQPGTEWTTAAGPFSTTGTVKTLIQFREFSETMTVKSEIHLTKEVSPRYNMVVGRDLMKKYPDESINIISTGMALSGNKNRNEITSPIEARLDPSSRLPSAMAYCPAPLQRPVERTKTTHSSVRDQPKSLKADILYPGQEVSVDHLVSSVPGHLYSGYGKGSKENMFKGSALFVDNATGFVEVHHQTALNAHEMLRAKENMRLIVKIWGRDMGVVPQRYHSDNASIFHSCDYKAHLEQFSQTQKFAGVGQHHDNDIVKKSIQDIQSTARTMLVHLAIHWPDQADLALFPMAITFQMRLQDFLRSTLPSLKVPRHSSLWMPLLRIGQENCRRPFHASVVPLVLNPRTGAISAQFNCVFDDWFATIATPVDDVPDFMDEHWQHLFGDSEYQFPNLDTNAPALSHQAPIFNQQPMETFDPTIGRFATTDTPQFELPKAELPQVTPTHPPDNFYSPSIVD